MKTFITAVYNTEKLKPKYYSKVTTMACGKHLRKINYVSKGAKDLNILQRIYLNGPKADE